MFQWTFNRVYVPQGHSLVLRYKGPPLPFLPGNRPVAQPGSLPKSMKMDGPWKSASSKICVAPADTFVWIGWWETKLIPDVTVKPGEVAVVSSKMGKDLKNGQFLVDGDLDETTQKGILRKVFGPGTYRINDYAYNVKVIEEETIKSGLQVKHAGWVSIPTGYVGVVTNLTDNPAHKGSAWHSGQGPAARTLSRESQRAACGHRGRWLMPKNP